jgi:DNA-binding CsgD family transcriptional regulator
MTKSAASWRLILPRSTRLKAEGADREVAQNRRPEPVADRPPLDPTAGGAGAELLSLVKEVVHRAEELDDGPGSGHPYDPVLLDIDVDGTRCLVIHDEPAGGDEAVDLSPREREVARMIAEGYPNKTIAAILEISSWTVSTYVRRIFAKLGVRSRAAMVALLVEEHVVTPRPTHLSKPQTPRRQWH